MGSIVSSSSDLAREEDFSESVVCKAALQMNCAVNFELVSYEV